MKTDYIFALNKRRETCIHEAAHAFIYAYGGSVIYSVEVAPEGISEGDYKLIDRKGRIRNDCAGLCSISSPPTGFCLQWDNEDCRYVANKERFKSMMSGISNNRTKSEILRQIRAHICGALAGPIAASIFHGEEPGTIFPESFSVGTGKPDDVSTAEGLSLLLPSRKEYGRLLAETERVLRTPEVWESITMLAGELARRGSLGKDVDEIPFLPNPLKFWPPPPRRKRPPATHTTSREIG